MPGPLLPWEAIAGEIPGVVPPMGPAALSALPPPGLLLELHMPGRTISQLLSSQKGSLAEFLHRLQLALSHAAGMPTAQRLGILSIHGRFRRLEHRHPGGTLRSGVGVQRLGEEVVVLLRLWGVPEDPSGEIAYASLRDELAMPEGKLHRGDLLSELENATLVPSIAPGLKVTTRSERDRMTLVSTVVLPVCISAAFVGILVWLAAM